MLSFPKSTEVNKFLPKEKLIDNLELPASLRASLKDDIKKFTITNELSPKSMNIAMGKNIAAVFVIEILLKHRDIEYKLIETLARQNSNKILFVLRYENEAQFAVFYEKLYHSEWAEYSLLTVDISGADFDEVWDNIVEEIALAKMAYENITPDTTLSTKLFLHEQRDKLEKEISRLEKQARNERQPSRKFELVGLMEELKRKVETLK